MANGEGRVVPLHGAKVGGEEIGDELEVEGEGFRKLGGEHGDERQVNGDKFGVQRIIGGRIWGAFVTEVTRFDAAADAEAQEGILVAPEVFA